MLPAGPGVPLWASCLPAPRTQLCDHCAVSALIPPSRSMGPVICTSQTFFLQFVNCNFTDFFLDLQKFKCQIEPNRRELSRDFFD